MELHQSFHQFYATEKTGKGEPYGSAVMLAYMQDFIATSVIHRAAVPGV